jgi:hypothetical protein
VFFNKKTGKLIVKDFNTGKDVVSKPKKPTTTQTEFEKPLDMKEKKLLNKKRVQNVRNDADNLSDDEDVLKGRSKKMKMSDNTGQFSHRVKNSHVVKFSGDEYKNKAGKGDKLLQGKYEPFAYIQLNPKTVSKRKRNDTLKIFSNIMHPEKNN